MDYKKLYAYIKERINPERKTYVFLDEIQRMDSKMLPLSFREFCEITGKDSDEVLFEYMKVGGLPYAAKMERKAEKLNTYLEGIYNTVIVKVIEERQNRKEKDPTRRKVTDIALLKNIAKFLASVVGSFMRIVHFL